MHDIIYRAPLVEEYHLSFNIVVKRFCMQRLPQSSFNIENEPPKFLTSGCDPENKKKQSTKKLVRALRGICWLVPLLG